MRKLIAVAYLVSVLTLSAVAQEGGVITGGNDRTPPPPPPPAGETQDSAPADPDLFDNEFTVGNGF